MREGFVTSWQWASTGLTGLLASILEIALTSTLSPDGLSADLSKAKDP